MWTCVHEGLACASVPRVHVEVPAYPSVADAMQWLLISSCYEADLKSQLWLQRVVTAYLPVYPMSAVLLLSRAPPA
jgi:hypothetical protein